jgi:DNA invertase Pin-like site-specific DNA recombinase
MSTEKQEYSPDNQMDVISSYALPRQIEVVRSYADLGRSGLDLQRRQGLRNLIDDVVSGRHDFTDLLVYDVSRWGRFQDVDESAYYEYICKRAGVKIHYCAEPFENDGSITATLLKALKRAMAAEYSRELSSKVFLGQSRIVEMGFRRGGSAGFGFRRQLLDRQGNVKGVLGHGEWKRIHTDRTVLIPGPDEELTAVRDIFDLYTVKHVSISEITRILNRRGVTNARGGLWTRTGVRWVLENPKYTGANVYNRTSFKLHAKFVRNPPDMWITRTGAFAPIISMETFLKAQEITRQKAINLLDADLVERLEELWKNWSPLFAEVLRRDKTVPEDACELLQRPPVRRGRFLKSKVALRKMTLELYATIKKRLLADGASVENGQRFNQFRIDGLVTVRLKLCDCHNPGYQRWEIRFGKDPSIDVTIVVRLKPGNTEILDFFVLPHLPEFTRVTITRENSCGLDAYRYDDLECFFSLWKRKMP